MKVKAANGFARILKTEGISWVSCYPTNHANNTLGEEGVPILMMGEERLAVAVADAGHFSFLTSIPRMLKIAAGEAARDPEGLDRDTMHEVMNPEVVSFFDRKLLAGESTPHKGA